MFLLTCVCSVKGDNIMSSLEFGRFGAEGLGRLVRESAYPQKILKSLDTKSIVLGNGAPQLPKPVLSDEVIHKKYNPRTGIWEEVAQKGQEYFEKCKKDFLG